MATLETCIECGKSVSSEADRCPNCGAAHKKCIRCYACGTRIKKSDLITDSLLSREHFHQYARELTNVNLDLMRAKPDSSTVMNFHHKCHKELLTMHNEIENKISNIIIDYSGKCALCKKDVLESKPFVTVCKGNSWSGKREVASSISFVCPHCGHGSQYLKLADNLNPYSYNTCTFCNYNLDLTENSAVMLPVLRNGQKRYAHRICYTSERSKTIENQLSLEIKEERAIQKEKKEKEDRDQKWKEKQDSNIMIALIITCVLMALVVYPVFGLFLTWIFGTSVTTVFLLIVAPILYFCVWVVVSGTRM